MFAAGPDQIPGTVSFIEAHFQFEAPNVSVPFDPDTGEASFQVHPTIVDLAATTRTTYGFTMGIGHETQYLTPTFAEPAGPLLDLNGGTGPDFFAIFIEPEGIAVEALYVVDGLVFDLPTEVIAALPTANSAMVRSGSKV